MTIRHTGFPVRTPSALPAWWRVLVHRMRHQGMHRGMRHQGSGAVERSAGLGERLDRADAVRAEAERRRVWF